MAVRPRVMKRSREAATGPKLGDGLLTDGISMAYRLSLLVVPATLWLAACATNGASAGAADAPASTDTAKSTEVPTTKPATADSTPQAETAPQQPRTTSSTGFVDWVAGFRREAAARGVAGATLADAFDSAALIPRVIELDNRQPEFNRAIWDYLDTAVSDTRVTHGREKYEAYRDVARNTEARYGVPGSIITAIWGMESNYGANYGNYETIDALATLGYDGRRESFAKNQLYAALKILANGDIPRDRMKGSWAGAMGNTQFIPTSFVAYAVDADGDGRRDIWNSIPDTMASTANYLAKNGWRDGEPWGREVRLPAGFDYAVADGKTERSSAQWQAMGVSAVDNRGLPELSDAGIIAPAGASGPAFMTGHNFRTILRYNNAVSYALGVALLSDRITGAPGVQADWPRGAATLSNAETRTLQANLNRLGYSAGTPDGILGPNTNSAVRAFQRDHGLAADGFVTQALAERVAGAAN